MAGRRRRTRRVAAAVCLLLATPSACGAPSAADTARRTVQQLLDRRAAAVLHHDPAAYAATGARDAYPNLSSVPFADLTYRVTAVHRSGDTATADAELRYRLAGYDDAPVTAERTLTLATTASGGWYVTADRPAARSAQQLWDQGRVMAVRGRSVLVLGVGQSASALRGYAGLADRAVPAVSSAWDGAWSRHVVVLVPGSLEGMAALLGSRAADYRGIAAVTTGEARSGGRAPADRIIVNPDAYGLLGPLGKQVVLTHETTHVATRAHTGAATPLWLSEGYADWVGYRNSGRTPEQAAPELAGAVAAGELPDALPADRDFAFTGDATALARAYEGGWMACRMIADRWGERRLDAFYRAVGAHDRRAGAVEDALHTVLGTTLEQFTAQWRQYLRDGLT
ncbi:hypothetical protein [Streptomyces sp. WAC00469]|uniref:hypothetical protein n=1 Tax=Streptomyces sp. WAC00469 TaxID=2487415 RepID=UPI000F74946A|nr:hypothetical protein [Streptomyces sp. WAC00469]RSS04029.1 hypothetical protein EF917_11795 [Streptomyces sp. WAC00469]